MTQSASSADTITPDPSTHNRSWLLVLIFRVLLLGVGGGLSLLLGIVLANIYPNPNPQKPLLLKMGLHFEKTIPVVSPNTSSTTTVPDLAESSLSLTPVQRQQVQAQLNQLQAQLKTLNEGVGTLEAQLGTSRPNESLEARLQAIALQLQGVKPRSQNGSSAGTNAVNQGVSPDSPSAHKLKVTLPSDVLFEGSNSILRPEAGLILDKIIADLRNYPSSTIRIAVHTDTNGETQDNRELSFRRAKAVEQYFARALGDEYRWLVAGYGETRPLVANDTDANQQRNRRIEIAVN
ncbi:MULTISPECIES: OmpA family protein [unclassified Coleofasciculus]|uniref:OmpA family protein n=1 Tax=unclassified Coleofasciculus TaxID=2692782 RepID=UPI00187E5671|nr:MULTISPECIES: OmpA family protein [unclassified Coleofasciculus]MBE9125187.1 OmpA family protein [Coleofasciculus sp. LEGE 07081]MBE9148764.1 OmpA family protein [Coleofasciculus sp. LEGE 07092]